MGFNSAFKGLMEYIQHVKVVTLRNGKSHIYIYIYIYTHIYVYVYIYKKT